jgi:hypothetical protein
MSSVSTQHTAFGIEVRTTGENQRDRVVRVLNNSQ